MTKLCEILESIEEVLPKDLIEEWDNSGLLLGDLEREIGHVRVALEATNEVVDAAIRDGVDLLVVHHPLIFKPMTTINSGTLEGRKVLKLIQSGIALVAAHSNLDRAAEGLNRAFGERMTIMDIEVADIETDGYVLKGRLYESATLAEVVKWVGEELGIKGIRYVGDDNKCVERIGFCTGSGMSYVSDELFAEVDVYLTGDLKYHDAMWVHESGYSVIDITHFGSEVMSVDVLHNLMGKALKSDIILSKDTAIINPIKVSEVEA